MIEDQRTELASTRTRSRTGKRKPCVSALVLWAALLVVAWLWGTRIPLRFLPVGGHLSPFVGWVRVLDPARWLLPIIVGAALVAILPPIAQRMRWGRLLAVSWLAAMAWAVSLAATTGLSGLVTPLKARHEYVHTLPALDGGVLHFLSNFVEQLPQYVTHTRGHPPGPLLVLYALEQLGLPVSAAEAALVITTGASAVVAVAVTVRVLAGKGPARRMLPFLVLAPMALWVASSMDAFFMGVSAWGVALLALATERQGRRAHLLGAAAGLLLGFGLYLSYGLAPVGVLPLAVLGIRRRWRLLLPAALGVAVVVAAFTAAGFWWFSGMHATHGEWLASAADIRPYRYFLLGNLAVLGFMAGPATAAGMGQLRDRRLWWLVGAALVALLFTNLTGYTRGEVERIWLPYAVWIVPAAAALRGRPRVWLAVHVVLAVIFQGLVHSPW